MKKLLACLLTLVLLAGLGLAATLPAAAAENPFAPPANLNELSAAEQLEYFNLVVNRVRSERPGFSVRARHRIDDLQVSGLAAIVTPIINQMVAQLMPGHWVNWTIANGEDNTWFFMSGNANASDLRPQDITSITSARAGNNWVIDVRIREETNPAAGLGSAHGRIAYILTREQILDEILFETGDLVTINPNDVTVRYHNGFARLTVNPQGYVIAAASGFRVLAQANNISIGPVTTNLTVAQSTELQQANFSWTDDSLPFPPSAAPEMELSWWQRLPACMQWVLRWVFFGWIWM